MSNFTSYDYTNSTYESSNNNIFNVPASHQFGFQLGTQAVIAGQQFMQDKFSGYLESSLIKHYFMVTNGYVLKKLLILIFPFRHHSWARIFGQDSQGRLMYSPPFSDINAYDLYIPLMSFVTHCIFYAISCGINGSFKPDLLYSVFSLRILFIILELIVVKLASYILEIGNEVHILDFLCLIGYSFFGISITILFGMLGTSFKYLTFIYTSIAFGIFTFKSLRQYITKEIYDQTDYFSKRKRLTFLFLIILLQICGSLMLI